MEKGADLSHSVSYSYDDFSRLSMLREHIGLNSYSTTYQYDARSRLISQNTEIGQSGSVEAVYQYDDFDRIIAQYTLKNSTTGILTKDFTYNSAPSGTATNQVATYKVTSSNGACLAYYRYIYDKNGNITQIQRLDAEGEVIDTTSYVYDSLNQLIRENNEDGDFTYVWTYDSGGNILSRTEYAYTTGTLGTPTDTVTYKYEGAGDVLTEYDGTVIENFPLGIYRCDGWSYTIDYGNRLVGMT